MTTRITPYLPICLRAGGLALIGGLYPVYGEENPPAPGFNATGSDPRAIAIADATMRALGGRKAWEHTRYLGWRFSGTRQHIWDRFTGNVRIEYDDRKTAIHTVILMNTGTRTGRVFRGGQEVTDPGERARLLQQGLEMWINDSYWLVMPYKLKDSGVTLRYNGEATMEDGRKADVLVLTFAGVGVTPENKYDVYVAKDTGLVEQWAYHGKATDEKPAFVTPWRGWKRYGAILLSADRGQEKVLSDIAVFASVPEAVLSSPAPVDLKILSAAGQ